MKTILVFSILFSLIALPALGELTDADLNQIRLIVKEEIKPLKTDINGLKTDVARLDGRLTGVEKQVTDATNVTYGFIALIVVAIGIPAWHRSFETQPSKDTERENPDTFAEAETVYKSAIANGEPRHKVASLTSQETGVPIRQIWE